MIAFLRFYIITLFILGAPFNTLVDGEHGLPPWYAPGEQQEARQALEGLIEAVGYPIHVVSGFRSYREQRDAYSRLSSKEGAERAGQVMARPGHSEHQLGTAFDLAWQGLPVEFEDARNQLLWDALEDHAHEFGFVISYPLKEIGEWPFDNRWYPIVTEFRWEPWHIRYVGAELATQIYRAGYLDPRSTVLPQDFYEPWP